jgi:hypothetical protein
MKRLVALLVSAAALSACSTPTEVRPRPVDAKPEVAKAKMALKALSGEAGSTSGRLAGN